MKKRLAYIAFLTLTVTVVACEKPQSKTKADVIAERLAERVNTWQKGTERVCLKNVMDAAEAIVDSTLLADARLKRDTSDVPAIPGRPQKPDFVAPADTSAVKPIFED